MPGTTVPLRWSRNASLYSDNWPLAKEVSEERLVQLAEDVSALIGRPVSRCIKVSMSNPFLKPEWMDGEVFLASLHTSIGANLRRSIEDSLEDSFGVSLGVSLGASLADLETSIRFRLGYIFAASIFSCVGFALLGEREKTERLARIVKSFLDGIMPLGFKKEEPAVLLLLVA